MTKSKNKKDKEKKDSGTTKLPKPIIDPTKPLGQPFLENDVKKLESEKATDKVDTTLSNLDNVAISKPKKEVKFSKQNDFIPHSSSSYLSSTLSSSLRVPENIRLDNEKVQRKLARKLAKDNIPQRNNIDKKVALFSHLPQYDRDITSISKNLSFSTTILNPHIIKLGLDYAQHNINGSNARCLALLETLKKFIEDYQSVPHKELPRDLESKLKPNIFYLSQCRPLSITMRNAIKFVKMKITKIPSETIDSKAKIMLTDAINDYIMEKIVLAGEAISKTYASTKISNNDIILIYSYSSIIFKILYDCHKSGKKLHVFIVDSRPDLGGQKMMKRLVQNHISCTYVYINNISHVMPRVNKVILGAHALLANGYVMGRVGGSMIALCAKSYHVPVLLCCETYKFAEKIQTDSFVYNELADPNELLMGTGSEISDWYKMESLTLLNITYDVTPPELITMVITELGMLPCTSVPVILRVKNLEYS